MESAWQQRNLLNTRRKIRPSSSQDKLVGSVQTFGMPFLPDFRVYQKAEPERLQDPEDEALGPVQNTQAEDIAVREKREWPHEKRHAIVLPPQKALLLGGISAGKGLDAL